MQIAVPVTVNLCFIMKLFCGNEVTASPLHFTLFMLCGTCIAALYLVDDIFQMGSREHKQSRCVGSQKLKHNELHWAGVNKEQSNMAVESNFSVSIVL